MFRKSQNESNTELNIMEVVGAPSIGKEILKFKCQADGKDYYTTNFSQMVYFATNAKEPPTRSEMYKVGVDKNGFVCQYVGPVEKRDRTVRP